MTMLQRHFLKLFFAASLTLAYPAFALDQAPSSLQVTKDVATTESVVLIPWNSDESANRLAHSKHKADFFTLANNFVSQENGIICGLASSAIILNSLRLGKKEGLPVDKSSISEDEGKYLGKDYNPYFEKYTQRNVLIDGAKSKTEILGMPVNIKGEMKSDAGLQLRQLATLLSLHDLDVKIRVADSNMSDEAIKSEIVQNLSTPNDYVLVNYTRKAVGQKGGGHISPVGAYDDESDSFLVMDVNPNRASWVWMKSKDLINAMKTFDTVENRGYLLISDSKQS
jgi:hypothetical protein